MKDDFKDGYRQGFTDGFKLAKETYDKEKEPYKPVDYLWHKKHKNDMDHIGVSPNACKVCGISFVDEMGRPMIMGYVCSHDKCPSKVTC
jgi:predicted Zn-ribbon and HTH transcriptional regulator